MPVWPPLAMMTPFLRLDVERLAVVRHGDAEHAPGGRILADDLRHPVLQQDLRALLARADRERAHDAGAVALALGRDHLGRVLPFDREEGARHRGRLLRPDQLLDHLDAVLDQEVVGRNVLVGEYAHEVAVAVAAVGVIGADPVLEHLVGRVFDIQLLLQRVPAAEMNPAAAQDAAAADVVVGVDDDDAGALVARRDRRRQARHAGADDHHVGGAVPPRLRLGLAGTGRGQCHGTDTGRSGGEKASSADGSGHVSSPTAIGAIAHSNSSRCSVILLRANLRPAGGCVKPVVALA